jgi:hypothetical protein
MGLDATEPRNAGKDPAREVPLISRIVAMASRFHAGCTRRRIAACV